MKRLVYLMLIVLIAAGASGCSLTLAGMTALDEAQARREARIHTEELDQLELGTSVHIHQVDTSTTSGELIAVREVSGDQVLLLRVQEEAVMIPLSQIIQIERDRKKYNIWTALAVGAAFDMVLIAVGSQTGSGMDIDIDLGW